MTSRIDRYRKCAAICAGTTFSDGTVSVRKHNAAADQMREIVIEPGAAEDLAPLLDEPQSDRWLAFQLLELCKPTPAVREKCLTIIRDMAAGSGPEALGAKCWLRDFKGRAANFASPSPCRRSW